MEDKTKTDKLIGPDIAGLIIIILIFLYFPYKMITEHIKDVKTDSYYIPYKAGK